VAVRRRLDGIFFLVLVDWAVAAANFALVHLNLRHGDATWAVVHAVLGGLLVGMGSLVFVWWLATLRG